MRKAMRATQPKQKARKGRPAPAVVHGQETSTANRTGRCRKCGGVYGLLKGGNVRSHKDLATDRPCPGGGRPAGTGRPKAAQPQRPAAQPAARTRTPAAPKRQMPAAGGPNEAQRERDRDPRLKNACAACGHPFSRSRPSRLNSDGYRNHASGCGPDSSAPTGGTGRTPKPEPPKPSRQVPPPASDVSHSDYWRIVGQVCAEHAADDLKPLEVILAEDGQVWIDRRRRDPRNVPFAVGRWKPAQ